jgi:hypothetical protein
LKKTLFFCLAFLSFQFTYGTNFYLKALNATSDPFIFTIKNKNGEYSYKVNLKPATEDFEFAIDIDSTQMMTVQQGDWQTLIYIEPNYDLRITLDMLHPNTTLQFEGVGAENNNFTAQFRKFFRNYPSYTLPGEYLIAQTDLITADRSQSVGADEFYKMVSAEKDDELKYLDAYEDKINPKLVSQIFKDIHYTFDTKLYSYFMLTNRLSLEDKKKAIKTFFSSAGFNYADYKRNDSPVFLNALKAYIHFEFLIYPDENDARSLYDLIGKKLEGFDKFRMQKLLLAEVFDKTKSASLAKNTPNS